MSTEEIAAALHMNANTTAEVINGFLHLTVRPRNSSRTFVMVANVLSSKEV